MRISWQNYTIPAALAYGDALQLNGDGIAAIELPATFISTKLNVQVSFDGITFQVLQNPSGTDYQITVAQGKTEKVNPIDFAGIPWVKLASGTDETTTRTIKVGITDIYI